MTTVLRLYEDCPFAGETHELATAVPRAIYVAAGSATIDGETVTADNGVVTMGAVTIDVDGNGVCLWRWEVVAADAVVRTVGGRGNLKLEHPIDLAEISDSLLLRLDSVAFPPGGCALLHVHQGPGIRCVKEGSIRIDTQGHSAAYAPGAPWFEVGPDPVFAQADADVATRFIRAMVLPQALIGTSSIRYVREEDKDKLKSQTYRVFAERAIA